MGQVAQAAEIAFVDQGYTGETTAQQEEQLGIHLEVVKLQQAKATLGLLLTYDAVNQHLPCIVL